ncbi:DUF2723 domain-containing protein [Candidatus Woesebacteria bacterium]|nr:DUF2723 domain-containing protein [Candidatus Woesebacteria bacterium]
MIVFLTYLLFFLFFQSISIYGGDAGDLVTAAYVGGAAHPPGYPLYSMLGYFFGHLPLSTVAWRIGLLSSVFSAGTLFIVHKLVFRITTSQAAAVCTTLLLAGNYLIWLYGIVPEVFAMHIFLMTTLLYISVLFYFKPSSKYLYMAALIYGLGISHHHLIILMLPASLYLAFSYWNKLSAKNYIFIALSGIVGLLPYLWVPYVAHKIPTVIWSNPTTLENMKKLITRADYGTFNSGVQIGNQLQSRILQFSFLLENYLQDFTIFGLVLFIIGAVYLYRTHRRLGIFFIIAFLISGPFYFFYASYLYTSSFLIGTAERFLLPSYIILGILIGVGIWAASNYIKQFVTQKTKSPLISFLPKIPYIIGALLIFFNFYSNYPKLSILKYDTTSEKFGKDILKPLPKNSIVLLNGDIAIFNTQYVVYGLGYRTDVTPIHFSKLLKGDMQETMKKHYPHVFVPPFNENLSFAHTFIDKNYEKFPIYTTLQIGDLPQEYTLIPEGLIFRLYKKADVPSYAEVRRLDAQSWQSYQDPLSGSLGKYRNLMQANVLDYYKAAHIRSSMMASIYGKDYVDSLEHLQQALILDPENKDILTRIATNYIDLDRCMDAELTRQKIVPLIEKPDTDKNFVTFMIYYSEKCTQQKGVTFWKQKLSDILEEGTVQLEDL